MVSYNTPTDSFKHKSKLAVSYSIEQKGLTFCNRNYSCNVTHHRTARIEKSLSYTVSAQKQGFNTI